MHRASLAGTQVHWRSQSSFSRDLINQWLKYHRERRIVAGIFPSLSGRDGRSLLGQDIVIAAAERGIPFVAVAPLSLDLVADSQVLAPSGFIPLSFEQERIDLNLQGGWLVSRHDPLGNPVIFINTHLDRFGKRGGRAELFQAMVLGLGGIKGLRHLGLAEKIEHYYLHTPQGGLALFEILNGEGLSRDGQLTFNQERAIRDLFLVGQFDPGQQAGPFASAGELRVNEACRILGDSPLLNFFLRYGQRESKVSLSLVVDSLLGLDHNENQGAVIDLTGIHFGRWVGGELGNVFDDFAPGWREHPPRLGRLNDFTADKCFQSMMEEAASLDRPAFSWLDLSDPFHQMIASLNSTDRGTIPPDISRLVQRAYTRIGLGERSLPSDAMQMFTAGLSAGTSLAPARISRWRIATIIAENLLKGLGGETVTRYKARNNHIKVMARWVREGEAVVRLAGRELRGSRFFRPLSLDKVAGEVMPRLFIEESSLQFVLDPASDRGCFRENIPAVKKPFILAPLMVNGEVLEIYKIDFPLESKIGTAEQRAFISSLMAKASEKTGELLFSQLTESLKKCETKEKLSKWSLVLSTAGGFFAMPDFTAQSNRGALFLRDKGGELFINQAIGQTTSTAFEAGLPTVGKDLLKGRVQQKLWENLPVNEPLFASLKGVSLGCYIPNEAIEIRRGGIVFPEAMAASERMEVFKLVRNVRAQMAIEASVDGRLADVEVSDFVIAPMGGVGLLVVDNAFTHEPLQVEKIVNIARVTASWLTEIPAQDLS